MPARGFIIHFPNGDYEYMARRRGLPSLGDQLRRKGSRWTVARIAGDPSALLVVPVEQAENLDSKASDVDSDPTA